MLQIILRPFNLIPMILRHLNKFCVTSSHLGKMKAFDQFWMTLNILPFFSSSTMFVIQKYIWFVKKFLSLLISWLTFLDFNYFVVCNTLCIFFFFLASLFRCFWRKVKLYLCYYFHTGMRDLWKWYAFVSI